MAKLGGRENLGDTTELVAAMARLCHGQPIALVAQAALDLALGLWAMDPEITREMAIEVVRSQIEARITPRSN